MKRLLFLFLLIGGCSNPYHEAYGALTKQQCLDAGGSWWDFKGKGKSCDKETEERVSTDTWNWAIPVESSFASAANLNFADSSGTIGKLTWDTGEFKFEGKADESAKQFFEYLKGYVDAYIKEQNRIAKEKR